MSTASLKFKQRIVKISFYILFIGFSFPLFSQQSFKVKKEDNRFLLFQKGVKNDTLLKHQTDLFYVKLPDSLKNDLQIVIENGQFIRQNDSLYQLIFIRGMSYSHQFIKNDFSTLLEGAILSQQQISVSVKNIRTKKRILTNRFIVK